MYPSNAQPDSPAANVKRIIDHPSPTPVIRVCHYPTIAERRLTARLAAAEEQHERLIREGRRTPEESARRLAPLRRKVELLRQGAHPSEVGEG